MKRIGILAALPIELKPLVKGWKREATAAPDLILWTKRFGETEALAGCGGMGADAVLRTLSAMENHGRMDALWSVGFAGSTKEDRAGTVCDVSEVVETRTGERFNTATGHGRAGSILATVPCVADQAEKHRLVQNYKAALVDMEAAAVARMANARSIPFHCYKAVSDEADERLPDFGRFISQRGQLKMTALLLHAVVRPGSWAALGRLQKNSRLAAQNLAVTLGRRLNEEYGNEHKS